MFKNYSKVFRFTFRNQVRTRSYIISTFIAALFLLAVPIIISFIYTSTQKDEKKEYVSRIENVYVVDEIASDADFSMLSAIKSKNIKDIKYTNYKTMEDAFLAVNDNDKTVILHITKEDNEIITTVVEPNNSNLKNRDIEEYKDYLLMNNQTLCILSLGINEEKLAPLMLGAGGSIYDETGFGEDKDIYTAVDESDEIADDKEDTKLVEMKKILYRVLIYLFAVILYFVILLYGSSISNNVVDEKSSKIIDTLLISVSPKSLLLGKVLGVLMAGFMQLLTWLVALVIGIAVAFKILLGYEGNNIVVTFFKSFNELGIFTPINVLYAIIAIITGITFYASLFAIVGAISKSKEEISANSGYSVMILLISFYIVLFGGSLANYTPLWMNFVPFLSALILPATLCVGELSLLIGTLAIIENIGITLLIIILASRIYKLTIFYRGKRIGMIKAIKMALSKDN